MHKYRKIVVGVFVILGFIVSSCITDDTTSSNSGEFLGFKSIGVDLYIKNETPKTKSISKKEDGKDDLNENSLQTMIVFLFDDSGMLIKRFDKDSGLYLTKEEREISLRLVLSDELATNLQNTQQAYTLTAVVNAQGSLEAIKSFSDLQETIQIEENLNNGQIRDKFLMDGSVPVGTIVWTDEQTTYKIPTPLALSRALAKIRMRISEIQIKEDDVTYEISGMPQVKLVNYTNETTLIPGETAPSKRQLQSTSYQEMKFHQSYYAPILPYYSTESDWSLGDADNYSYDIEREAYFEVKLDLTANHGSGVSEQAGSSPKAYYYRIPVNYRFPISGMSVEDRLGMHKLQRNHLYDIVSRIHVLGSEDPQTPIALESAITVQPWNVIDEIDGNLAQAHYLIVKEREVVMPNIAERDIEYASSLPVEIEINEIRYTEFTTYGDQKIIRLSDSKEIAARGIHVTHREGDGLTSQKSYLHVQSPVPTNNVPLEIDVTVRHKDDTGSSMSEQVRIIQYPPKYVTGETSTGFINSYRDINHLDADFRFHDTLGSLAPNPLHNNNREAQQNKTIYRITTIVNNPNELIGDPTNDYGRTKNDNNSNQLVSPDFVIASQHGMSLPVNQYSVINSNMGSTGWKGSSFGYGFGPLYGYHTEGNYCRETSFSFGYIYLTNNFTYKTYTTALERCDNYFEGEYGYDGLYTEYFINTEGFMTERVVEKRFKNKGRWRIPTAAELKYINDIQRAEKSAVKSLLWGKEYWTAEEGKAYSFENNSYARLQEGLATVRCVFDVWKTN